MSERRFEFIADDGVPPGAWCLVVGPSASTVVVRHGRAVATGDRGFFFGAWTGPCDPGATPDADVRMGSGAASRDGRLVLVPPTHPYAPIHVAHHDGHLVASNSLVFLLAETDSRPRLAVTDYYWKLYKASRLPHQPNPVRFDGLRTAAVNLETHDVDAALALHRHPRRPGLRFDDFASYRDQIIDVLSTLACNGADPARQRPYDLTATLSTGYDSPAAAVLGHAAGWRVAATVVKGPDDPDDGTEIGARLGYTVQRFAHDAWHDPNGVPEAEFAASAGPTSAIHYAAAEPLLHDSLLLTGSFGDAAWAPPVPAIHDGLDRRYDFLAVSESMNEWTLRANVVHIPIPMFGADRPEQLRRLSGSSEMVSWRVAGPYDRPIPRRLVEEAGIPREMFGQEKRVSPHLRLPELTEASQRDYDRWRAEHRLPLRQALRRVGLLAKSPAMHLSRALGERAGIAKHALGVVNNGYLAWETGHAFHWGVERIRARYGPRQLH